MTITVIRVTALYLLLSAAVRLMGKRQLGDMHPAEAVITFLLSDIAASSIVDTNVSMLRSMFAVLLLISFEVVSGFFAMKSERYRTAVEGKPMLVICDGVMDRVRLKQLRMSADDIYEALRQKDVFDISTVKFGVMETSGMLSVLLKEDAGEAQR